MNSTNNLIKAFKLSEIANWQLPDEQLISFNAKVKLPPLQRGFVWKPAQVETLWDSLLRGFPIGAFLLSEASNGSFELLDGQQRATSIALGYYNPWEEITEDKGFWSLKNIPSVWIDLIPKLPDGQRFLMRVLTRSHPWGYQAADPKKPLSQSDRREALARLEKISGNPEGKYTSFSAQNIFPYDATLPVPLAFVLQAANAPYWKAHLRNLCEKHLEIDKLKPKHLQVDYLVALNQFLESAEADSWIAHFQSLSSAGIPATIVPAQALQEEEGNNVQNPTLFVRLNSAGTPLNGEDLIYSIYKAAFPEAKELVEEAGLSFVAPSRLITLFARLVQSEIKNGEFAYAPDITVFKRWIKEPNFRAKLKELIPTAKEIVAKAVGILQSKDELCLPPVLVKKLIRENPDFFLLLIRALRNNLSFGQEEERTMRATFIASAWFVTDKQDFVRHVWKDLADAKNWTRTTLTRLCQDSKSPLRCVLLLPQMLCDFLPEAIAARGLSWDDLYPEMDSPIMQTYNLLLPADIEEASKVEEKLKHLWDSFINRITWNRDLLLFAQRHYLNDRFEDFNQFEDLSDTSTPWDWDHIYPSSFIYYKQGIDERMRFWNNTIGNQRAMALSDNRSENAHLSPAERLQEENRRLYFIYDNDWPYWQKLTGRVNEGNTKCVEMHLRAITLRLCNIYKEWFEALEIEGLFSPTIPVKDSL